MFITIKTNNSIWKYNYIYPKFTIILIKFNRNKENREHEGVVLCYNFN